MKTFYVKACEEVEFGIFIVIIWHQAGGRNNSKTYYCWENEKEEARVFDSYHEAQNEWNSSGLNQIHAAFIVDCRTNKQMWI
jgi:hypothetical protein